MVVNTIIELLSDRILILDGGLGSMIQGYHLTEDDYRGDRFAGFDKPLKGCLDVLNLTRPDVLCTIQHQYMEAGADIITTNTFNANAVSMKDYGLERHVREINLEAVRSMRNLAYQFMCEHPERMVFVAGSIGPTNKSASMNQEMKNTTSGNICYMDLYHAYHEQIIALINGGVDLLLFETAFDTLNIKAGLEAAVQVFENNDCRMPIMLSVTTGKDGRLFSGQTLNALLASIQHIPLTSIGLNCSYGASDMKPFLKELADVAPYYISAYPNAGLPNRFGQYDEAPESMAMKMKEFVDEGLVNIIGGCCGTTPAHIAQYPSIIKGAKPHQPAAKSDALWLSGLELLEVKPENNFINIGERCNVSGSRRFLRLIKEKKYEEALSIARKQVDDGAQVIDISMDDGMLDAAQEMKAFLRLAASDPDIARVPFMIDSSSWKVIEQALMCVQGKSIVNSVSLKEGTETFIRQTQTIRRHGAAVVVMAFDEKGQAESYQRKINICARVYKLLTEDLNFPPQDIIFDPNVLAIATGIPEHNRYGLDFIRATGWIKKNLPYAKVSGGISNLSFSFRGNNYVRDAMHAVFLYHAIRAGLDMGIVNPSSSVTYDEIEPTFRELLEDVVLARRPEAADELIVYAQEHSEPSSGVQENIQDVWREQPVASRIEYALMKGIGSYLETDLLEALQQYEKAVQIIEGPLMSGMNRVGELFAAGKMFLPQVIKTARTMKKAVEILQPAIENEKSSTGRTKAGKVVFATVKGDVHDIGKNIVSIVLACNNFEVIDLGVMTPAETILKALRDEKPDLLCLSGLITPSLAEMVHVVSEMQKAGMQIPVMIGGATTSQLHTALMIAPHYDYPVLHVADASQNPVAAARLLNPETRDSFVRKLNEAYERLRREQSTGHLLSLAEARSYRMKIDRPSGHPPVPGQTGINKMEIPVSHVIPYINWKYFFSAWKIEGIFTGNSLLFDVEGSRKVWKDKHPVLDHAKAEEAWQLFDNAWQMLRRVDELSEMPLCCEALYGFFPAASSGDDIRIGSETIPMLRQQTRNEAGFCLSLADFVASETEETDDYAGLFAVTSGKISEALEKMYAKENDQYNRMLIQTLSDRLVEAASEYLHEKVRKELWGYDPDEAIPVESMFKAHYSGIRPAVGFPSLPDQGLIFAIDRILNVADIGISLTENGAMTPASSVTGFYFSHHESKYFMVGPVSEEQLQDYAVRRGVSPENLRKFLSKNLIKYHI